MPDHKAVKSAPWSARFAALAVACAARLPISWARALGRVLGAAGARLPNELRAVSDLNLRLCFPDLQAAERRRLVRRSLQETAAGLLEIGAMWRWPVSRLEELEEGVGGEELLRAAMGAGRGVILLVPHLGNWEFLNHFLMRRTRLHCLYRPPRVRELDDYVRRVRGRTGCVSVPATRGGVRRLLGVLRAGELVLILPDQEPLKAHGVSAPFFGVPALTMTLVSRLLRRTGAAALYAFAERRPRGKFRVRFLEAPAGLDDADFLRRTGAAALYAFAERRPRGKFRVRFLEVPAGLDDADVLRAAAALNRGVEACVRLCPEQYLWSYKRFKTAPPGELTPYRAIWSRRKARRHPPPPHLQGKT